MNTVIWCILAFVVILILVTAWREKEQKNVDQDTKEEAKRISKEFTVVLSDPYVRASNLHVRLGKKIPSSNKEYEPFVLIEFPFGHPDWDGIILHLTKHSKIRFKPRRKPFYGLDKTKISSYLRVVDITD